MESDTNTKTIENQIIDTLKAAVSNDELSRSTESDSGFDSATGGGRKAAATTYNNNSNSNSTVLTNGGSNKLPSRAKVTTTNEKENDNNANNKRNADNDNTRVMENATTKNGQQREPATLANSKEAKPPKKALIPLKEQGKQEQDGDAAATATSTSATASLPYSSAQSATTDDDATTTTTTAAASSSTLKRLRKQLQMKSAAEVATDDVNMWANKFLRDLDNLMASDKIPTTSSSAGAAGTEVEVPVTCTSACTSPGPTSPMLLSAAATAVIQSRYGKGAHDRYIVGNGLAATYDHQQHQGNAAATLAQSSLSSSSSAANGLVLRPEKHVSKQSFESFCFLFFCFALCLSIFAGLN